jgi:membrane protease YdiL (CAAX protease family)
LLGLTLFATLVVAQIALLEHYFPGFSDTRTKATLAFAITRESVLLAAVAVPTLLVALLERRSPLSYGLVSPFKLRYFATGLVWGLACASLLIISLFATGHLAMDGLQLHGFSAILYGVLWAGCFFVVGLTEETLFRGYLQSALARLIGFWPAAIALSTLFGIAHLRNSNEALFGIAVVALGGAFFTVGLRRTGSLWWAIGFHTAWDWSQSFLYGTPDSGILIADQLLVTHPVGAPVLSGGAVGPEGSVLVLPVMSLALILMFVALKPSASGEPSQMSQ